MADINNALDAVTQIQEELREKWRASHSPEIRTALRKVAEVEFILLDLKTSGVLERLRYPTGTHEP